MFDYKEILIDTSSGDQLRFEGFHIVSSGSQTTIDPTISIYKTKSRKWVVVIEILREDERFSHHYPDALSHNVDSEIYREAEDYNDAVSISNALKDEGGNWFKSSYDTFQTACEVDPELTGRKVRDI